MAYEFKKLSEVLEVETANSTAKVLIEEEGIIKKVPKDEVGGLKEVDWEIITNKPKIVTSWNDLEDKPFGVKTEMVEIVPEQSVTGTIPQVNEGEPEFYSNTNPPTVIASLKLKENASYKVVFNGKEYICKTELWEQEFTGDGVADVKGYKLSTGSIPNGDVGFAISRGWSVIGGQTEDDVNTVIEWSIDNGETITLAIYEEQEVITPIDINYLPIEELKKALGLDSPQ